MTFHDDFAARLDDQIADGPMDCCHASSWCRYQCPAHHGVGGHADTCPPADPNRAVCSGCAAELQVVEARLVRRMHQQRVGWLSHVED